MNVELWNLVWWVHYLGQPNTFSIEKTFIHIFLICFNGGFKKPFYMFLALLIFSYLIILRKKIILLSKL